MKKLYIIKAGSTFKETAEKHGDFEEMTLRGLGADHKLVAVINACEEQKLPMPETCYGAVITGAHCMVTDNLPWSLAVEEWIQKIVAAEVPLLGVCYGHQLLGRAMGGQVGYHPRGKEVGTFEVRLRPEAKDDILFKDLPQKFPVHATHSQSVLTLPPGAVHLAENDFEPHHAMRIGNRAWGVQFHPEYSRDINLDYVKAQAKALARAGQDVEVLLSSVRETPEAASLLHKFSTIALSDSTCSLKEKI